MLQPIKTIHTVTFDAPTHTYTVNGIPAPSVTTILKRVKPPFDQQSVAKMVAYREGLTVEAVLDRWKRNSERALSNGNKLHQFAEATVKAHPALPPIPDDPTPEQAAFIEFWLRVRAPLTPTHSEAMIGDPEYGIAGTIDFIYHSSLTGKHHIIDWKTGKFATASEYSHRLLPPFDDLPNCQFAVYSLQVSIYRLMLERHGYDCGASCIVYHAPSGPARPVIAMDLRARVHDWLLSIAPSHGVTA